MPVQKAAQGLVPPSQVDVDELLELQQDLHRFVESKTSQLERNARLLRNLHTFYGTIGAGVPGDMTSRALTKFASYLDI